MKKLSLTNKLFAIAIPLVTGSVLLPAVAEAATFAFSNAEVAFTDFNITPESQDVSVTTDVFTEAISGSVTANSDADAIFLSVPPIGGNFSLSEVEGSGTQYRGNASSQAQIIGRFFVPQTVSNSVFRFNFIADLNVTATVDQPAIETAASTGEILFSLFAGSTPDNLFLVDSFSLSAAVNSANSDDFLNVTSSQNIQFNQSVLSQVFGGLQESAIASINGSYSRDFAAGTHITLVETKTNRANAAAVPEPSTILAVVLSGTAFMLNRGKAKKQAALEKNE